MTTAKLPLVGWWKFFDLNWKTLHYQNVLWMESGMTECKQTIRWTFLHKTNKELIFFWCLYWDQQWVSFSFSSANQHRVKKRKMKWYMPEGQQWVVFSLFCRSVSWLWCLHWPCVSSDFYCLFLPRISMGIFLLWCSHSLVVSNDFYFLCLLQIHSELIFSAVCNDLQSAVSFIFSLFQETVIHFFLPYALGSALSFVFFFFRRFLHHFWPKCGISTRLRLAEKLETAW